MKIIGLGHYSRTGKDTFANALVDYLQEYTSLKVKKIPFAWKLKQICHELYAWDGLREPEFYDTPEGEKFRDIKLPTIGKTPVEIWVAFGTPAVREQVYQGSWIDFLLKTDHGLDVMVIPDVRFPNEVAAVQKAGGKLIKIVRPGYGPRNTVADKSLIGFTGWDYVFGANGDIRDLRGNARAIGRAIEAECAGFNEWPIQTSNEITDALSVEKAA